MKDKHLLTYSEIVFCTQYHVRKKPNLNKTYITIWLEVDDFIETMLLHSAMVAFGNNTNVVALIRCN